MHKNGHRSKLYTGLLVVGYIGIIGAFAYFGLRSNTSSHAATGATLSMSPASISSKPGATFVEDIMVDSLTTPVNAVQATVLYPAAQLQVLSVTEATPLNFAVKTDTSVAGVVKLARSTQPGAAASTGSHVLVHVTFQVKDTASGSGSIHLDQANSSVVRASDNSNILALVKPGTFAVTATASPKLTVTAPVPTVAVGQNISFNISENSLTFPVNTTQVKLMYPANQLKFVSLTEGTAFPGILSTDTSTSGVVRLARYVTPGAPQVTNSHLIAKVTFKALAGAKGSGTIQIDKTGSMLIRTSDSTNILKTVVNATYTVQ